MANSPETRAKISAALKARAAAKREQSHQQTQERVHGISTATGIRSSSGKTILQLENRIGELKHALRVVREQVNPQAVAFIDDVLKD